MLVKEMSRHGERRSWALIFETDDLVMETLERFADENDVRGGSFKALGAFRQATLAYFDWESKDYQEIPVEEQVEVTALVGDVARSAEDDAVEIHAHCVLGRPDGTAMTGHLMEARVRPTLELFLVDEGVTLPKREDPESGLTLIRP